MDHVLPHAYVAGQTYSDTWSPSDDEEAGLLRLELLIDDPEVVEALSVLPVARRT